MIVKFKTLVFCLIVLEAAWLVVPTHWSFFGNDMALGWVGAGGNIPVELSYYLAYALSFLYFFIYLALYTLKRWARVGLLIVVSIDLFLTLINGLQVYSGFELVLAKLLLIGAALAFGLTYSQKLNSIFSR